MSGSISDKLVGALVSHAVVLQSIGTTFHSKENRTKQKRIVCVCAVYSPQARTYTHCLL